MSTALAVLAMVLTAGMAMFAFGEAQGRASDLERELAEARAMAAQLRDELARHTQTELEAADCSARLRQRLRQLCNLLPIGVVILNQDEAVEVCNGPASAMLRPRIHAPATTLADLSPNPDVQASVRQALHLRRTAKGAIAPAPGRFLELIAHPLEGGDTLLVLQDVSELRLLRTVRRDFVANVSHELRTPLASIRLLVDTLEAGALEEAEVGAGFVHRIGVEADHLIQMVTELLELSRIESGQLPVRRAPVALDEVVQQAVERLGVVAHDKGIVVSTEIPEELPEALADRDQIVQVLLNLLFNAIKFTPREGRVHIRAQSQDRHLTVSVADTGVGIPREDIDRIFERFYKSDKSRARSDGGTGLGLPIARHIVESHGGSIWAESEEGQGSTFTFTLPAAQGRAVEE